MANNLILSEEGKEKESKKKKLFVWRHWIPLSVRLTRKSSVFWKYGFPKTFVCIL